MSTGYSKTLLRKGGLKSNAGHSVHHHAPRRKGVTTEEEDALLHSQDKSHASHASHASQTSHTRPHHGAKMRAE